MTKQNQTFDGTWHSTYWYPSNKHDGEDTSKYEVTVYQQGNSLVLESKPNDIGAYILIRLTIDGNLATGTWHETTSPDGEFKGMIYSGALQLLISEDGKKMTGKWVGIGRDHHKDAADIYSGRWELIRNK
jgi:hypothetical protein